MIHDRNSEHSLGIHEPTKVSRRANSRCRRGKVSLTQELFVLRFQKDHLRVDCISSGILEIA